MPLELIARKKVSVGSTRLVRINCTNDLDDGASLTGTPSADEQVTSDLTVANKAVNTSTYSDEALDTTVAVGKAIEFTVAGGVAGKTYRIRASCSTDSSPAETLVYDVMIEWI